MKVQLDTVAKTIKVEEQINLGEFIEALDKLLPNDLWKEFKLETNTVINNWNIPVVINPWFVPAQPQPLPWITYNNNVPLLNVGNGIDQGVYCLDITNKIH